MIGRNRFDSPVYHASSPMLFAGVRGVPVYTTPGANYHLSYNGLVVAHRAQISGASATPMGAPLPPVPVVAPPPGQWVTPSQAIAAAQGGLSGVSGIPTSNPLAGCRCGCK